MRTLVVALALAAAAPARADAWRSDVARSELVVHVWKKGLFKGFAHDHHFAVTDWSATATFPEERPEDVSVEVIASARSLRDGQRALSEKERAEVDARAAGPEVLDAEHHPSIVFRARGLELAAGASGGPVRGTLEGSLTLRGRSRPVRIAIDAERAADAWRVRGSARVKQTDFGIRPFSGFAGTVGVRDEMTIDLSLTLERVSAPPPRGPAARPASEPATRAPRRAPRRRRRAPRAAGS